ncbi:hypothetical protein CBW65_12865 [Tumebacillus avium]|uniref:Uncharacterized protein n=1 Tax=Tumebacillus avium TaxID=1903704 RepID=A0A1Y0IMM9_9BACL|nr:hypothetical protein [Tumebacillus avium]ARU61822.1 hypothetical protein CBW65_12865 [Tumebacillus avium]
MIHHFTWPPLLFAFLNILLATQPEANAALFAHHQGDNYRDFTLYTDGIIQQRPDWKNSDNPAFGPQMLFQDINQDQQKDIIILLTTGHGTGLIQQEAHVFHGGGHYPEFLVDNPMAILLKNVHTKLTKQQATITINGKTTVVDVAQYKYDPEHILKEVILSAHLHFEIINNKLTAIAQAQIVFLGGSIGEIHITYGFKNNMYQAERIEFIPLQKRPPASETGGLLSTTKTKEPFHSLR